MNKYLLKIIIAFVFLVLMIKGAIYYASVDAKSFCDSIYGSDTVDIVKQKANEHGYKARQVDKGNVETLLIIPTKNSPFFRFACVVFFEDGVVKSKSVSADD